MADKIPIAEQISEVKRELYWRQRVYTHRVAEGKMLQRDAVRYTMRLEAVLATLLELQTEGRLL